MKSNIGILNALCRITCGLTILAWATAKLTKRSSSSMYLLAAMMGAMKVGEGITRFCPITKMVQDTVQEADSQSEGQTETGPSMNQL
ncbi:YgaP family membrane protein [Bacillus sp. FJAT-44742]|uniref:YgaP family membrane protein n=1 Tax=Bacillus sp. FJAT-44742 TaxID=2014005 RepID=UPI000C233FB1|nr:DUF2892 domain-containing protein [Bacillus sp. FJAT-44742]